jgi:hypothetical protein
MGERIVAADAAQFNSVGVQLGYYYDNFADQRERRHTASAFQPR